MSEDFVKNLNERYNRIFVEGALTEIYEHNNKYIMFQWGDDDSLGVQVWVGDGNPLDDMDFSADSEYLESWKLVEDLEVDYEIAREEYGEGGYSEIEVNPDTHNYHELVFNVLENLNWYLEKKNLL